MPVYSYDCTKCNHLFDEIKSVRDHTGVNCPKCGGKAKKIITYANFVIEGFSAENGYSRSKE